MTTKLKQEAGFTLVELVMAMAIFSFLLSIIMVGFLGVVRSHEAGVVQRNTQQNSRIALDQITKAVQQSATATIVIIKDTPIFPARIDRVCLTRLGQNQVLEVIPVSVSPTLTVQSLVLGSIPAGTCQAPTTYSRLTDNNVTVTQFKTGTLPALGVSLGTLGVTLSVASAFGQNELTTAQTGCKVVSGSQFCAVTTVGATAVMRGGIE